VGLNSLSQERDRRWAVVNLGIYKMPAERLSAFQNFFNNMVINNDDDDDDDDDDSIE
jgi:hypothetical protein